MVGWNLAEDLLSAFYITEKKGREKKSKRPRRRRSCSNFSGSVGGLMSVAIFLTEQAFVAPTVDMMGQMWENRCGQNEFKVKR